MDIERMKALRRMRQKARGRTQIIKIDNMTYEVYPDGTVEMVDYVIEKYKREKRKSSPHRDRGRHL